MAVDSPAEESDQALLLRHRPLLLWDSQDDFRAMSAESIMVNPGNVLEADGRIVAVAAGEGGRELTLDLLADGIEGVEFDKGARLKEAPFPFVAARRLQSDDRYARRTCSDSGATKGTGNSFRSP